MLAGFVIVFLLRSKHLLIFWLWWFWSPRNKVCHCFHFSPSICHELIGPDAMILVVWMLSSKPAFSFFSFTLIKRLFSSSLLSAIRIVLFAYLRLLIFFLAIMIPAWASSSPTFHMIYSACKFNKQGDSIQLCCTSFPVLNQSN